MTSIYKTIGYLTSNALQLITSFLLFTFLMVRIYNGYFQDHLVLIIMALLVLLMVLILAFALLFGSAVRAGSLVDWYAKRNRLSDWLFQFVIVMFITICFLGVEHRLGARGMNHGVDPSIANFHVVDSVYLTNEFYADSFGISRANKGYSDLAADNGVIRIDSNGFRNNGSYSAADSSKKKVLLLGDSFTWGWTAKPITCSFADILAGMGFGVYNTGIPGADPVQYDLVCHDLASVLKPDIICTAYCLANDGMDFERPARAGISTYFWTNIGFISTQRPPASDSDCRYCYFNSAQEAYDYHKRESTLFAEKSFLVRYLSQTIIGTILVYKVKMVFTGEKDTECKNKYRPEVTRNHLLSISAEAKRLHAKSVIIVIPDKTKIITTKQQLYADYPGIFENFDVLICPDLTLADYADSKYDGHFNNKGHRKFAEYLGAKLKDM